jgi:hypothetical protein
VTPRRLAALLALLGIVAAPASAQGRPGGAAAFSWVVKDLRLAACMDFLIEPSFAEKQVPEEYHLIPAGRFSALSPVLARELTGDSVHTAWIPASVCVLEGASVTAGDQFVASNKPGESVMVAYWGIAATRATGEPRFDQLYVAEFWTSDWHIQKPSQDALVHVSTLKRSQVKLPESVNDRYELKIGKTVLTWDGQLKRDSTATTGPLAAALLYDGQRGVRFTATVTGQPTWTRNPAGVFRVSGKDDLAKALQASPVRHFGPLFWGGDARVDFLR